MLKLKILINILQSFFTSKIKSEDELKEYQQKKIQKHLSFVRKQSPYYKNIATSKLNNYPIMNKMKMMESFDELNTVNINLDEALSTAIKAEKSRDFSPEINDITIGLSSGTSGNKGIFLVSKEDKAKYVQVIYEKVLRPIKWRKTKVALFFRANSNLYESVKSLLLQFEFFDLTKELSPQFSTLNNYNPHIIVAPPTLLNILADYQKKGKIELSPEKIISVAEVLEEDIKEKIEATFNIQIDQLYQCTEGFLGSTCSKGKFHLHEEYIFFEKKWIDKTSKRFYPIITDFTRKTQPIIRYELNDILVEGEKCSCGSPTTVIKKIEGRSDDIFSFLNEQGEETIIFPDEFRNTILIASNHLENFTVRRKTKDSIIFSILLENRQLFEAESSKIKETLTKLLVHKKCSHIKVVQQKWEDQPLHQKQRRIFNEYKGM